ncbi:MAG: type II CRISPR-associated endonuclease Cas1 [Acholeplasma sp.]|nr:type II CRISPR-associated endonuclease Cas1 [Acholeplasma sp.]
MSWRILYIEESDYLSLYLDNIKVVKNQEDILIPLSDINTIVLDNYKITLSVHLIIAITTYNVNLIVCNLEHLPYSLMVPFGGSSQTSFCLRKQIEWSPFKKGIVHQQIIKSKIYNQLSLLKHLGLGHLAQSNLSKYHDEVELHDATNREGLSAKMYFRALFGESFKRFNEDSVNAGLNYGYAIIRSQISKVIISKGYHTSLGFFHKGPSNLYNLSDDFIEPFRPIVDYWVYNNLLKESIFTKDHRLSLVKLTTCDIYYGDTKQSLFNTMRLYIDQVIAYAESQDEIELKHPILKFNEL